MTGAWGAALLGALQLAAAVQLHEAKKGHLPKNIAAFVLPDGQVLLDGDTYATVVASDGSEHAELERRKHLGYARRKDDPVHDPLAGTSVHVGAGSGLSPPPAPPHDNATQKWLGGADAAHFREDGASPEEARGCEDTEGWVNGFTGPSPFLADYWLEAESEIETAGHKGVMLWIHGKGNTCAAYVFMGVCVNMKWIDDAETDWPCMMDAQLGGTAFNHPEHNCCACGKAHISKGAECSNETQIAVWKNARELVATVGEAFEGTEEQRLAHDFHTGSAGAALSLLALSAL